MMLPTHALLGMLLALPVAVLAPEYATVALSAGLVGGVLPDLDLYVGHRRTLHYPVYYSLFAVVVLLGALASPTALTIGAGVLLAAAAAHSLSDVFGGGLELRPWEATSERAVYDHYRGRWLAPRRWVRYDGAPEDFLLAAGAAAPLWLTVEQSFRTVVLVAMAVATVYVATRRLLPRVARLLFAEILPRYVPASVLAVAPERYLVDAHAPPTQGPDDREAHGGRP